MLVIFRDSIGRPVSVDLQELQSMRSGRTEHDLHAECPVLTPQVPVPTERSRWDEWVSGDELSIGLAQ